MTSRAGIFCRLLDKATLPVLGASLVCLSFPAFAETKAYVVNWFYPAAYSQDGDCPGGLNPPAEVNVKRILTEAGKSPADIERLMTITTSDEVRNIVRSRGIINGQPANVYRYPESVPDPHIHLVQGRYAYGFNLDGKGGDDPQSFEDPDTGEKGIDNQLFRALGCFSAGRATPKTRPVTHSLLWDIPHGVTRAWLVEISGVDDLQNDDDVTVGIYLATRPVLRTASGTATPDMTFTVDQNPRTQNTAHAKIKNGVLTTTQPFDFFMIHDPVFMPEISFKQSHLRIHFNEDGSIRAILGGYHPWMEAWLFWAKTGTAVEVNASFDVPGFYYALKQLAEASPDPMTGQNTAISAAYWIDAVPAFVVHPEHSDAKTVQLK